MPALELSPRLIARLFAMIPDAQWDVALDKDRFTPREVIAHLADWEPIMLARMQSAVAHPGAAIEASDEGQMAEEHNYRGSDPKEQLKLFAARRAETIAWLRALPREAWDLSFLHPERGLQSIEDQANLFVGHDVYHGEQLSASLCENSSSG
jgi:hypothetical protein